MEKSDGGQKREVPGNSSEGDGDVLEALGISGLESRSWLRNSVCQLFLAINVLGGAAGASGCARSETQKVVAPEVSSSGIASSSETSEEGLDKKLRKGIAEIEIYALFAKPDGEKYRKATCTSAIYNGRVLLTAKHCFGKKIEYARVSRVNRLASGDNSSLSFKPSPHHKIVVDPKDDLAVVVFKEEEFSKDDALPVMDDSLLETTDSFFLGHFQGNYHDLKSKRWIVEPVKFVGREEVWSTSYNTAFLDSKLEDVRWDAKFDPIVQGGNSGGPLTTQKGKVGIVTCAIDGKYSRGVWVTTSKVEELIKIGMSSFVKN